MTRAGMIIGIPGPEVVRVKSKRGMEVLAELTICAAGKGVACPAGKALSNLVRGQRSHRKHRLRNVSYWSGGRTWVLTGRGLNLAVRSGLDATYNSGFRDDENDLVGHGVIPFGPGKCKPCVRFNR